MKKYLLLLFALISILPLWSQRYEAGVIGGMFSKAGQMDARQPYRELSQSMGVFFSRTLSENLSLRSGLRYAVNSGNEELPVRKRMLELSVVAELNFMELNPLYNRFTPYLFIGSGISYHQLQMRDEKVWRARGSSAEKPLEAATMGGATAGSWSFSIPTGAGVKFLLGKRSLLGFETGFNKRFSKELPATKSISGQTGGSLSDLFGALRFSMFFGTSQKSKYLQAFYRQGRGGKQEMARF